MSMDYGAAQRHDKEVQEALKQKDTPFHKGGGKKPQKGLSKLSRVVRKFGGGGAL